MIYRILAFVFLYVALPVAWVGLGAFMLFAPARFGRFIDENVVSLGPAPRAAMWGKLAVRAVGAGLIAFAARFVLRLAALFR